MDKFGDRLKKDADAIDAEVPASLRARIDANLEPLARDKAVPPAARKVPSLWLGVSAAAGLMALALLLLPRVEKPVDTQTKFAATPTYTPQQTSPLTLELQPVELTEPLEQELQSLRADIEKVRTSIEQELRSTL